MVNFQYQIIIENDVPHVAIVKTSKSSKPPKKHQPTQTSAELIEKKQISRKKTCFCMNSDLAWRYIVYLTSTTHPRMAFWNEG